jgi:hypothetical protein
MVEGNAPRPEGEFKYFAFVSYSHQDNRARRADDPPDAPRRMLWGDWLHEALETYRIPRSFVGKANKRAENIPARLVPCFQDEKELPTEARLQTAIEEALRQSRYLIVICSPRSARSIYVDAEVAFFKKQGRTGHILPLIVGGEPNAALTGHKYGFRPEDECFSPALKHPLHPDGAVDETRNEEPICADARWGEARRELASSGSHGCDPRICGDRALAARPGCICQERRTPPAGTRPAAGSRTAQAPARRQRGGLRGRVDAHRGGGQVA